jgi:lipid-A-disaccharide synthase
VIFPFEEQFYQERGVDVDYVGHPLADLPQPTISRDNFAAENGLNPRKQWIGVLPGSRRKEVEMNLPAMLAAGGLLGTEYEYVLPVAPTLDLSWLSELVAGLESKSKLPLRFTHDARSTLIHSRAAMVASGTATVEAALIGTPFVMVYRVSDLTWKLGRRLVKVPHFGMVNLIAGREVVPELVQSDFQPERVAAEMRKVLDGEDRDRMLAELAAVRQKLHPGADGAETAVDRAANAIVRGLA